jgi:hypothetical protein
MKKIGQLVALAALATVVASCAGADDGRDSEALGSGTGLMTLCRDIQTKIRGRAASIWKVDGIDDMLAVDVDGYIVCVDTVEQTLDLGLIAVPAIDLPISSDGPLQDGTPIPAAKFNAAARDHGHRGRYFFF